MITVSFAYNNHRGVTEARTVDIHSIDFLREPGFGYQPGWFLTGYCHDRKACRSFALTHIVLPPDTSMRIIIDRLAKEEEDLSHGNEDKGYQGSSEEGTGGSDTSTGNAE